MGRDWKVEIGVSGGIRVGECEITRNRAGKIPTNLSACVGTKVEKQE